MNVGHTLPFVRFNKDTIYHERSSFDNFKSSSFIYVIKVGSYFKYLYCFFSESESSVSDNKLIRNG